MFLVKNYPTTRSNSVALVKGVSLGKDISSSSTRPGIYVPASESPQAKIQICGTLDTGTRTSRIP